jgi:hypothetical protein
VFLYAYAGGDPVNRWDPSGLDWVKVEGNNVWWVPEGGAGGDADRSQWWLVGHTSAVDGLVEMRPAFAPNGRPGELVDLSILKELAGVRNTLGSSTQTRGHAIMVARRASTGRSDLQGDASAVLDATLGFGQGYVRGGANTIVGAGKLVKEMGAVIIDAQVGYLDVIQYQFTGETWHIGYASESSEILNSGEVSALEYEARLAANVLTFGTAAQVDAAIDYAQGEISDDEFTQRVGGVGVLQMAASARATRPTGSTRPGSAQGRGGSGRVLRDGEGATPAELAASRGGPTGGSRAGQGQVRQQLAQTTRTPSGRYQCWRCGAKSNNLADFHLGHRNVATSHGGNLSSANVALEGAACNLSAGNRGGVGPAGPCASRGGPGAPYGRFDPAGALNPASPGQSLPGSSPIPYPLAPFPYPGR